MLRNSSSAVSFHLFSGACARVTNESQTQHAFTSCACASLLVFYQWSDNNAYPDVSSVDANNHSHKVNVRQSVLQSYERSRIVFQLLFVVVAGAISECQSSPFCPVRISLLICLRIRNMRTHSLINRPPIYTNSLITNYEPVRISVKFSLHESSLQEVFDFAPSSSSRECREA